MKNTLPDQIQSVLFTEQQIHERLDLLANEIHSVYSGSDLTLIAVLTGSVIFVADLLRRLQIPLRLDSIGVSSYRGQIRSTGDIMLTKNIRLDVRDRDVLIIDDILDTGLTLNKICEQIRDLSPASLRTCVLIEKNVPHHNGLQSDFVGFKTPNRFVVGYGLDFEERYRNLPYLASLKSNAV